MSLDQWTSVLDADSNPDLWADVDLPSAGTALDALDEAEWSRLAELAMARSAGFRRRLAQAQLYSEKERATALLCKLLDSPESEVGAMAAEMLIEKGYSGQVDVPLRAAVQRHLDQARPYEREALERLLRRLVA